VHIRAMAQVVVEIKDPAAVPALIEALLNGDSHARAVAARALGEIKDPAAVPALIKARRDNVGAVYEAVVAALVKMNK